MGALRCAAWATALLRVQAALEAQVAALQSQLTAAAAAAAALAAQVRRRDTLCV